MQVLKAESESLSSVCTAWCWNAKALEHIEVSLFGMDDNTMDAGNRNWKLDFNVGLRKYYR